MKIKILLILIWVMSGLLSAHAQVIKLSEQPDAFIADVQAMMAATRNPQLIQSGKTFETLWADPRLNAEHKSLIITLSRTMIPKGYKQNPYYYLLFESISNAIIVQNIPADELSNFLKVTQRVIETTDSKTFSKYLEISRLFFTSRLLYASNTNKLYALSGTYTFKFSEQPVQIADPAKPKQPVANFEELEDDGWGEAPKAKAATQPQNDGWGNEPDPVAAPTLSAGAIMEFKGVTIGVVTPSDSVNLFATDGILSFKDGVWAGENGRFTWETTGMPNAYVMLKKYTIQIRNPKITASEATLNYADKLNSTIDGAFEYFSKKRPKNVAPTYPRFISQRNDVILKNLGNDIEYHGGFSLFANKMYSSSVNDRYATITIKYGGKVAFRLRSRRFELGDSLITSPQATFSAYFGGDSLYHPGVKVSYSRKLAFLRTGKVEKGGFRDTPYADGFHKMEIYADVMHWNLPSGKLEFYIISGKSVVPALFESFDYFNAERYTALSGQFPFHPMQLLNNYFRTKSTTIATLGDLSGFSGRPYGVVREAMLSMLQQGMVDFDEQNETVRFSRKGKHYLEAYNKRKDYDTFLIPSFYGGSSKDSTGNASINLKDNILTIRGVKQFQLSDSLGVYLNPRDHEIRMGKDRDFSMTGEFKTGNFRFRGQQFAFSYKDFLMNMNKIDSITFIPQKVLAKGGKTEIGGDLRYSSGKIYINRTDNKSGRMRSNDYPRLVIPEGVTVYFDQADRGLAYDRKQVYFKIPSIDYDSLNVKDIDFAGTFHSGGIFPVFQTTLITMPDNSLGFSHKPPTGTYKLYNSASSAKFEGEITMDKNGIHAQGELSHLTAVMQAKDILFTPDSLIATGTNGEIKEGASGKAFFPKVDVKNFSLKWVPKADSMTIANKGGSFDFYNATTKLSGKLLVRSLGLFGFGTVKRTDSETISDRFKFDKSSFLAEKAEFKIGSSLTVSKPVLLGNNVDVNFNVAGGLVNIKTAKNLSMADSSGLTFPFASYRTSINSADWNINAKTIAMKGDVKTSTFTSLEPDQQGLSFNATAANYDIEKMTLNVSGVPFIKSADAKIIPDKGLVAIRRDAAMQAFKNAKVVLDTLNEYHRLANANIQIISRKQFEGDGIYQYVHAKGDTSKIKMSSFEFKEKAIAVTGAEVRDPKKKQVEKAYFTEATAVIGEKETFKVSPKLRYRGDITMLSYEQTLQLDGFIQPMLKKRPDSDFWIPYKATNAQNAPIQITKDLKADGGANLVAGLHFRSGSSGLYSTFLTPKEDTRDEDIFVATGILNDIAKDRKFEIATPDPKGGDKAYEGNRYTFDDTKGIVSLDGKFEFFRPQEYFQAGGTARIQLDSAKYQFNQLIAVGFPLPAQALTAMGEKIVKTNLDERNTDKAAEEDRERLLNKLGHIYGNRAMELYRDRSANDYVPLYQVFPKLNTTLVFSNVNLRWSEDNASFYSVGKIGVANIANTDINAQMDGFIEIRKTQSGDEFNCYLESSSEVWYYFSFRENQLGVVSSDLEFNNFIAAKAPKGAKSKEYLFTPAGEDEKMLFVERFTELYKPKPKTPDKKATAAKKEDLKKDPKKKAEETKEGF
ncbi:MAG: hypothetical protein U0Y10_08640 [Spirosomataceae bacterium]